MAALSASIARRWALAASPAFIADYDQCPANHRFTSEHPGAEANRLALLRLANPPLACPVGGDVPIDASRFDARRWRGSG